MNNNYENLPAVLNATQLASALGISRAGAYQLLHTEDFPTLRRVVVIRAPFQRLCYTVRDAVDWYILPTTRWFR